MPNILDYLNWRGDISFEQVTLNEIDSLILSRLSYFPFDNLIEEEEKITIEEAYHRFQKNGEKGRILQIDDLDLFPALAKSPRFKHLYLTNYINKIDKKQEKQLSAITIFLPNKLIYVSYRGTDNTLIGWKEDFNMSFTSHLPSQKDSANYLNEVARNYVGNIIVGGHSKGGNLAVYAAMFCNDRTKKRIQEVYNEDGPGFDNDIIETKEYQDMISKVHTYLPQSSVFGRLLNHQEEYTIVKSTANGIMQHDLYSWQVLGAKFVALEKVTDSSQLVNKSIKNWLEEVSPKQRAEFFDILFQILNSTDASTVAELSDKWFKTARNIAKKYQTIDPANKEIISQALHIFIKIVKDNVKENILPKKEEKKLISASKIEEGKLISKFNKEEKKLIESPRRKKEKRKVK